MASLNWLAILIAFVVLQALGFFWYHEAVLGTPWMQDVGLDPSKMGAPHPLVWVVMAASTLIKIVLLAVLLGALRVNSVGGGLLWGAVLGLGLLALPLASHHGFAMQPVRQIWIEGSQEVLGFLLAGGILAALPRRSAA